MTRPAQKILSYLDGACKHGRIVQFFLHPHYLSAYYGKKVAATERVLKKILDYAKERSIAFTTTNAIARFWKARAESTIKQTECEIHICAQTDLILTLPATYANKPLLMDGISITAHEKTVNGRTLTLVCIPQGDHIITA